MAARTRSTPASPGEELAARAVADLDQLVGALEQDPSVVRQASALEASGTARRALFQQLRKVREEMGLTQSELAARVGTSQPAIARLEAGLGDPQLSTVERCAAAMELHLEISLRSADALPKRRGVHWTLTEADAGTTALQTDDAIGSPPTPA